MTTPALPYSPGLEGVVAGETKICTVEHGLSYRGYTVDDLADHCSFDEVAYLLLHGELPNARELQAFIARVAAVRQLPPVLPDLFAGLPKGVAPLDALRTAVSVLGHFDPDAADNSHDANLRKAERLVAQIPVAIATQHRIAKGLKPVAARPDLGQAANFLYVLRGSESSPEEVKALDVSLILYAEHEFNASTFAARVIVSSLSDIHSGVTGAIGALKGPLHGGANEKVMDILIAAGGPENAEAWVRAALARKERIMGFGHRVYKAGDVRAGILRKYARAAAEAAGATTWEDTADIIERVMVAEKGMYPNLDWPAGRLYHAMKLEIPLYTPIFAMSRITGWAAHVIEQLDNNRLIRPRALYKGPVPRSVTPISGRG
ncbi:citrate synthase : Citrate synthase OS=Singulisphaera acidiphila (strain ATCC BAA-1392 / DSM 18658 / VKM B-2454 / MOB10) GN=Sinac_5364 PE=3 SV=1: Citrate_synt [Gemmataceae bacterium]|nr:citrate synthase : Citrate synthase OS=Singulisphaera acidiphila (strain ATCC BAA-1392 / DSM 18658 / VKM B-2454 / MOB10) GN=Sinac_5364 PE=3 SV=1: Citrate_synt [Gemmataceae bacterium]VTT99713.1 citrate synthase : Citrate synthase OS=Singulisphaera acidiphila (strain ATCC BAA-1392 / DSM 18658 / VKM B-2454 / MOB10) GN=Sinac_5364 PE=3 SV=1: Citrate_synt [Gemmataceae bacterium]